MVEILRWGELERSLEVVEELLNNPKTLHPFAKRLRLRAKEFVEGGGAGAWSPPAASTLKRWASLGASAITKQGDIRQAKLDRIQAEMASLRKRTAKGGWGEADRARGAKLAARLERLLKQRGAAQGKREKVNDLRAQMRVAQSELREARKDKSKAGVRKAKAAERKLRALRGKEARASKAPNVGKRVADVRQNRLMPRMPGTIRTKVRRSGEGELTVLVYSAAGEVGLYHHTGTGKNDPQRTIVPEASEDDLSFLVDLLEGKVAEELNGEAS